jgi:sporulation protein YlmC with PRC-barrel domain
LRTLSSFIGRKVETESGIPLGHCHDLRAEQTESRLQITAICVGRWGVPQRLGIKTGGRHNEIAWSSIVRIDGDRIVVRDP